MFDVFLGFFDELFEGFLFVYSQVEEECCFFLFISNPPFVACF